MEFLSFGSGSSGNCYYLATERDAFLIDAGVGTRLLKRFMMQYGLSMSKIRFILLTHDHADHIKSVGALSEKYSLPVYATKLVHEGVWRNWAVKKKIPMEMHRFVEKGTPLKLYDFSITPFNIPHDSSDNVGYSIEAGGIVFSIITDCGHMTDEIGSIINKSDYLVIEANHDTEMLKNGPYPYRLQNRILGPYGHMSNENCGEALVKYYSKRLSHVWLCHLSEHNNNPRVAKDTVAGILRTKGIIVGQNIELDVLNRKIPTGIYSLT